MAALGDPSDADRKPPDLLKLYVDQFRQALLRDHRMCLCGVLASEMTSLPGDVVHASQAFFEQNLNWLEVVLRRQFPRMSRRKRHGEAVRILALLEGAMVVAKGDRIEIDDLSLPFKSEGCLPEVDSIAEVEKLHIQRILIKTGWNITRAADLLGIKRATLYNKIEKYGLRE